MKASQAKKLSDKARKNIKYSLSPYIIQQIKNACSHAETFIIIDDWNFFMKSDLEKLGYRTEVYSLSVAIIPQHPKLVVSWD